MKLIRKNWFSLLLVLALGIVLCTHNVSRADGPGQRGMGLILSSPSRYLPTLPPGLKVGSKQPPAVDNSTGLPPVGDQGSQNSSVAWATTYYYKTFQEEQDRGWGASTPDHQFSPAMTYNMRTKFTPEDCSVDGGMRFPDAMDILLYDGALPMSTFPYSDTDTCTQPTAPQLVDAQAYRSLGYGAFFVYGEEGHVTETQIDVLKAHLANGDLLVMGIPVYEPSFTNPEDNGDVVGVPGVGETFYGFHAVTVVGYDDAVGGFKFVNSWGSTYAGDGAAYLSYDFVRGHAREAWWMMDHLTPKGCLEGTVRDTEGQPVAGVTITVDGPTPWTGTTDASGHFGTGSILELGTYTVTSSKAGYAFTPGMAEVVVTGGQCAVQDFTASGAVVYIVPTSQTLTCGEIVTFTVAIRNVANFYGAQFHLTFDPTAIEVIDPDGDPGNGIIVPGDIFPTSEYEVGQEIVDNAMGEITYAISLLRVPKAPPFAGSGTLAEVTVRALADGVSPLIFVNVAVADHESSPIDTMTEDGIITVECPTTLTGYAYLESRTDHSGITVTLEGTGLSTLTDASGAYTFSDVPAGTYTVTFQHDYFLSIEVGGVAVPANEATTLCGYTLLAGDLTNDGVIDILDIALGASHFGTTAVEADVNGDGQVDIYDLVLIGKNFKLASPQPGVCTP